MKPPSTHTVRRAWPLLISGLAACLTLLITGCEPTTGPTPINGTPSVGTQSSSDPTSAPSEDTPSPVEATSPPADNGTQASSAPTPAPQPSGSSTASSSPSPAPSTGSGSTGSASSGSGPATSSPVTPNLIVGSFANTTAGSSPQSFLDLKKSAPGMQVRRDFNPGMPATIARTEAAGDEAAGIVTFLSVKPSYTDVGSDNARIASLAKSMPAGSYLTAWHEPENDMSAAQYVAMFRNFYATAKAANPNIYVGNVYMTYQWGRRVTTPDAWWVGSNSTDFLATDTYMDTWQKDASGNPRPLSADANHMTWHNWAASKGKPLLVTELGVGQGFSDAQRARYYALSAAWMNAHGYRMLLFWNGAGTPPTGESWDFFGGSQSWPLTMSVIRAIARTGAQDPQLG